MSLIEITATLFGVACVYLTIRRNIWCWPTGLIMVSLYIWIFWQAKLYSDMGLQVVYIFLQLYGWWAWLHGGEDGEELEVQRLTPARFGAWVAAGVVGTVGLGYVMSTYTDADLPYWDACTTVLSLIAQWLMAKKILENWVFWIVVDVLAVGIYFTKGLYPTTGLYALFLLMAASGLVVWWRVYRVAEVANEPVEAAGV